jgi:hypothetical protein
MRAVGRSAVNGPQGDYGNRSATTLIAAAEVVGGRACLSGAQIGIENEDDIINDLNMGLVSLAATMQGLTVPHQVPLFRIHIPPPLPPTHTGGYARTCAILCIGGAHPQRIHSTQVHCVRVQS